MNVPHKANMASMLHSYCYQIQAWSLLVMSSTSMSDDVQARWEERSALQVMLPSARDEAMG